MGQVDGLSKTRMTAMEAQTVISGSVNAAGDLTLTRRDGGVIQAGNVKGPKGDTGPASIALLAYPVGSILLSVNSANPSTYLGGTSTWVAWATGKVPVGIDTSQTEFDTVEETGGAKTHTLTSAQIPSHTHAIDHDHPAFDTAAGGAHTHATPAHAHAGLRIGSSAIQWASGGTAGVSTGATAGIRGGSGTEINTTTDGDGTTGSTTHTHNIDVPAFSGNSGSAGTGGAHNNLQPYITCYMWKRTA